MYDNIQACKKYIEDDYKSIRGTWEKRTAKEVLDNIRYLNFVEEFHALFDAGDSRLTPEILAMLDSKVSPYDFLYQAYMKNDSIIALCYDYETMLDFLESVFDHESKTDGVNYE